MTSLQLREISQALLTVTGRVTMLSISRWTEKGGSSYRTVQRGESTATSPAWVKLLVQFFEMPLFDSQSEYLLAGDSTVAGKAGKKTHEIDRYFSGVLGQAVRGLEFFVFAVVIVNIVHRFYHGIMNPRFVV